MEIVIEPSLPLLEITPRCWTDCCVADCGGFCIRDCSSNCDANCRDCTITFG